MTTIQMELPEVLCRAAKRAAAERGMSLSGLVCMALEAMLNRSPAERDTLATWELPKALPLGGDAFLDNPDWRYELNQGVRPSSSSLRAR